MNQLFALPFYGVLHAVAFTYAFWCLYVFAMGAYRAKMQGRLSGLTKWLAMPVVLLAVCVDVFAQFTLACVVFLDWPRETLVTKRLQRYMAGPDGWRRTAAQYVCDNLLDPFDPKGDHC